jgi:phosphopantothenoylcysteine decarboxylase/phosphopantothenate--cysteine ligase
MGYAIAEELAHSGAEVILVSGPVNIMPVSSSIQLIKVTTAQEMHQACLANFSSCHAAIMCAAVADYRPLKSSDQKIKKEDKNLFLSLEKTPDILSDLGKMKKKDQILFGFALETDNELDNARLKIAKKNLDLIILNSLKDKGAGFQHDTNQVTFIDKNNNVRKFELKMKSEVAQDIVNELIEKLNLL